MLNVSRPGRRVGLITVAAVCVAAALPAGAQALNPQPEPPGIIMLQDSLHNLTQVLLKLERRFLPPGPCLSARCR